MDETLYATAKGCQIRDAYIKILEYTDGLIMIAMLWPITS